MRWLSTYAEKLCSNAKAHYEDKLAIIGGNNPFLPGVFDYFPDLVSYLVLHLTAKQYKACKGLEAYNQFLCGWVKYVSTCEVCGKYLITARVSS